MAEALPNQIQLSVVTPDRQVVRESVDGVTIPGKRGYLGILPGHAPLLSELTIGELEYTKQGNRKHFAVSWGFAEVLPDRVIILAQTAECADEIDVERAEKCKLRAEERLKKFNDPEIDMERARTALERALSRIQTARRARL
jgi:F-type H+-transporting ATPase subunit epsilon